MGKRTGFDTLKENIFTSDYLTIKKLFSYDYIIEKSFRLLEDRSSYD